jgi:hypothetical protein
MYQLKPLLSQYEEMRRSSVAENTAHPVLFTITRLQQAEFYVMGRFYNGGILYV